jgi:DNA polymerase
MARTRQQLVSAADYLPDSSELGALAAAAEGCRGCELYKRATQTVFGEGPPDARLLMVGEQPGDAEDHQGRPFVGPSGKLLREVLDEVGLDPEKAYVTNAVKHFKWVPRGTRRLHAKPSSREMTACRPWLMAEIDALEPECIVCLGASAAQTLLGAGFRILRSRGQFIKNELAPSLLATYHPSAVLRAPDPDARRQMRKEFVADLRKVARRLAKT